MATLDIREENEITEIPFDYTSDRITHSGEVIILFDTNDGNQVALCDKRDIDNLIKALQVAKELWC